MSIASATRRVKRKALVRVTVYDNGDVNVSGSIGATEKARKQFAHGLLHVIGQVLGQAGVGSLVCYEEGRKLDTPPPHRKSLRLENVQRGLHEGMPSGLP